MAYKIVQFRRGTTDQNSTFVGAQGEITVDTDKWTAIVHDGVTPGGYPLKLAGTVYDRPSYVTFRAATVQNGTASLLFSTSANPPAAISIIESSGLVTGAAVFSYEQGQSVQGHFSLPDNWVAPINLEIVWRTTITTGTVQWGIETMGLSSSTVLENATFNPKQSVTSPPVGLSGNAINILTIPNLNTTNLIADGECFFRFSRLVTDTVIGDAELLALRFVLETASL